MSLVNWIITVWLGCSATALGAVVAYEMWLDHDMRKRVSAHLAEDRELAAWVQLWEDHFALTVASSDEADAPRAPCHVSSRVHGASTSRKKRGMHD